jgi:hypothetical protein
MNILNIYDFLLRKFQTSVEKSSATFLQMRVIISIGPWLHTRSIVLNLMHKGNQVANHAHPSRRSGKIKELVQEVERHLAETTRN